MILIVMKYMMNLTNLTTMTNEELLERLKEIDFTPDAYYRGIEWEGLNISKEYEDKLNSLQELIDDRLTNVVDRGTLYAQWSDTRKQAVKELLGDLHDYEEVECKGGEGEGDNYYFVLYFPIADTYIRSDGFYASYEGASEFCDWQVVHPIEKTIIIYE
jgi:hypothetical protein